MMGKFSAAEADGAYAGMDTIAVHTEEHIVVFGLSCADGNILDMMAAVSYLAALENRTYHAVSEVEASTSASASASGHMAACLLDGGS